MRKIIFLMMIIVLSSSVFAFFNNPFSVLDISELGNITLKINIPNKNNTFCLQDGNCSLMDLHVDRLEANISIINNETVNNFNVTGEVTFLNAIGTYISASIVNTSSLFVDDIYTYSGTDTGFLNETYFADESTFNANMTIYENCLTDGNINGGLNYLCLDKGASNTELYAANSLELEVGAGGMGLSSPATGISFTSTEFDFNGGYILADNDISLGVDNKDISLGISSDLVLNHDGINSNIISKTGDLKVNVTTGKLKLYDTTGRGDMETGNINQSVGDQIYWNDDSMYIKGYYTIPGFLETTNLKLYSKDYMYFDSKTITMGQTGGGVNIFGTLGLEGSLKLYVTDEPELLLVSDLDYNPHLNVDTTSKHLVTTANLIPAQMPFYGNDWDIGNSSRRYDQVHLNNVTIYEDLNIKTNISFSNGGKIGQYNSTCMAIWSPAGTRYEFCD